MYGELGRKNFIIKRYFLIIRYWFKILMSSENKYIKQIYQMMLNDIDELPNQID